MVGPVEAVGMGLGLTYRGEKNMVSAKLDVRFPDHQSLPILPCYSISCTPFYGHCEQHEQWLCFLEHLNLPLLPPTSVPLDYGLPASQLI